MKRTSEQVFFQKFVKKLVFSVLPKLVISSQLRNLLTKKKIF